MTSPLYRRIASGPWPLLGVLLLALALRLALWSQPLHQPANDEVEYVTVAYDLLVGRGWTFYDSYHWLRAPLYPLFLAGSLWLTGGNLYLAALPNILLSVASVYLVYLLTAALVQPIKLKTQHSTLITYTAPLIAALLTALLFTLNTFASLYMSETLFSFLFTAALLCLLRWKRRVDNDQRAATADRQTSNTQPETQNSKLNIQHSMLVACAGICFGLATLTRSLLLAFLPIVVVWIMHFRFRVFNFRLRTDQSRIPNFKAKLGPALLFVAFVALPIAPWTLRNCLAYGRCILVETGLSYNLWAFSEPHEDQQTIFRTLEQIPNPADRADAATQRGLERLREDPAILLRKLWPNWFYLWRVKIIQDRFLLADYAADPPPLVFLGSLVLDDILYAVILIAGVVGLLHALARGQPADLLLGLWAIYIVVSILLTHGESRYRHFLFPVLIPYAAIFLTAIINRPIADNKQRAAPEGARRRRHDDTQMPEPTSLPHRSAVSHHVRGWGLVVAGPLMIFLLYTLMISYPWNWAQAGAARSLYRLAGDIASVRGDREGAAAAYERALSVDETPDGWIALGDVRRQQGDLARAEAAYRAAWRREPDYVPASARLGDLLRAQGYDTAARDAFAGRYVDEKDVIDWSWANIAPPPTDHIDVGDGLDFGYVGGMYAAEPQQGTLARWSDGQARFRLTPAPASQNPSSDSRVALLRMRLAAPHPETSAVTARVCAAGRCQPIVLSQTWRVITLLVPAATTVSQPIELHSPTFTAPDGRALGVLVDWVGVEPGAVNGLRERIKRIGGTD